MLNPKISVITVVYNAVDTLADTLESVLLQDYQNVEHIVIDGVSTDGTLDVLERYRGTVSTLISEPDSGIFDAMNKGIDAATGDVIGFLNADDVYAGADVLGKVADVMSTHDVQACYGDVIFVRDDLQTIVRYYRSNKFSPGKLRYGWMPAHPSLYLKRDLFEQYGCFKTDYKIAADYELVVRLFGTHRIRYKYLPKVFVKMRMGGTSTGGVKSSLVLNREIVRACKENGINTNIFKVLLKFPQKITELVFR